jgi:hypothetical protein
MTGKTGREAEPDHSKTSELRNWPSNPDADDPAVLDDGDATELSVKAQRLDSAQFPLSPAQIKQVARAAEARGEGRRGGQKLQAGSGAQPVQPVTWRYSFRILTRIAA